MALVKGVCPNCGKEIKIEENDFNVICTYCGVPFFPHEAVNLYKKQLNDILDNVNVDVLDITADNISNYATLGLSALKDKNPEKCGFYADDILKRKENSPEGLLLKGYFISSNYSKEEGIHYFVSAYNNASDNELKTLILDTLKGEFVTYSIENYRYLLTKVIEQNAINDLDFVKYTLTYISTSVSTSVLSDLEVENSVLDIYFDLSKMNSINVEKYNIIYDSKLMIVLENSLVKMVVDKKLVSNDVERFKHNKDLENVNYYFYFGEDNLINLALEKVSEDLENVLKEMNFNLIIGKSGCYIATCVYESYLHPNVRILRQFRDEKLSNSVFGKLFINLYYFVSPILVKMFRNCEWFKTLTKKILDGLANDLSEEGFTSNYIRDKR